MGKRAVKTYIAVCIGQCPGGHTVLVQILFRQGKGGGVDVLVIPGPKIRFRGERTRLEINSVPFVFIFQIQIFVIQPHFQVMGLGTVNGIFQTDGIGFCRTVGF